MTVRMGNIGKGTEQEWTVREEDNQASVAPCRRVFMDYMFMSSKNSYLKVLIPNMRVFEVGEVIRFR